MKEAYSAAGEAVGNAYKKRTRFSIPPLVTTLLLVAAVVFLVLGWYEFENVIESTVACAVAVIAVYGMFQRNFIDAFNNVFDKILKGYSKLAGWFIHHKITGFSVVAASIALLVWLMSVTATSLVPNEDTGSLMGVVDMPPATSMERTVSVMNKVDSIAGTIPAISIRNAISGYS